MAGDVADEERGEVADPALDGGIVHEVERGAETEEGADDLVARGVIDPDQGRILVYGVGRFFTLDARGVGRIGGKHAPGETVVAGHIGEERETRERRFHIVERVGGSGDVVAEGLSREVGAGP